MLSQLSPHHLAELCDDIGTGARSQLPGSTLRRLIAV